jgi:REP element-mobilizing transposase RayT
MCVFVTWRLAGSLPRGLSQPCPASWEDKFVQQDRDLHDSGSGAQWLRDPRLASIVADALRYGAIEKRWYELLAWVVMSNHVHIVIRPELPLHEIMCWLKSRTSVRANRILNCPGAPFWQREYFDHWLRSDDELYKFIQYVEYSPVAAGLVKNPEDWPWSSGIRPAAKTAGVTLEEA